MKHKTPEKKTELQVHLEQLFNDIKPTDDAPKQLKEEVFDSIATIELVGDIMDLFTGKFGQTELGFIDLMQDDIEDDKQKK